MQALYKVYVSAHQELFLYSFMLRVAFGCVPPRLRQPWGSKGVKPEIVFDSFSCTCGIVSGK